MSSYDIGNSLVNAFLYMIILSVIGSAFADIFGQIFGIVKRGKRVISTTFCIIIVTWWKVGLFTILFGNPKWSFIPWFATTIDCIATAFVAGAGSGFVADMFRTVVAKFKEWREIATFNKLKTREDISARSGNK